MQGPSEFVVDFPTLGFLAADYIEAHCIVPKGFKRGLPFTMADWQLWCTLNHYRVKPTALWRPEDPMLATAFHNRRSQVVAPQKTGKGPWSAAMVCNEATGPSLFAGWAQAGDVYDCADDDCHCGFIYEYSQGEPKGMRRPDPEIQLLAASEDQVRNVYGPLQEMVKGGPLAQMMRVGEEFIRINDGGRIDPITSSALSRLGNPITYANMDETGTYTDRNKLKGVARTMRRGLAGMGGRAVETTNSWDPSENSTAQNTYEAAAADIFRFFRQPPPNLKFKNNADRRKILRYVYEGSTWVDLDGIEAEALELMEKDPQEAERFFGNILSQGKGAWMPEGLWKQTEDVPV
ncbi:terminase [Arthrobacter agilis]|uniref:terminase n=1 Tax=Arthrobacter agilis TaxID=37921 RepID=UPI002367325C|nr:terminase [Arthrobacter agilis]WDF32238.1 terminase [Arthrobacter agilis]